MNTRSSRNSHRLPLSLIAAALMLAVVTMVGVQSAASAQPVGSAQPAARAARVCTAPKYPGQGYFTSLSVTGTSCATGDKLVLAYYHCRTAHGPAGTCHSHVLGYTCQERRNSIPTEIEARVTCRRGGATVVHTYQQDT